MNGLLHRLAARAAGTTVAVRCDARLPFAGASFGWGEIDEIDAPPRPLVMEAPAAASHPVPAREAAQPSTQRDDPAYAAPAPVRGRPSPPPQTPRTDVLPPAPHDAHTDGPSDPPTRPPVAPSAPAHRSDPGLPPRHVEGRSPPGAIQVTP